MLTCSWEWRRAAVEGCAVGCSCVAAGCWAEACSPSASEPSDISSLSLADSDSWFVALQWQEHVCAEFEGSEHMHCRCA